MTDLEIASKHKIKDIKEIVKELKVPVDNVEYYGRYKAKIKPFGQIKQNSKLILVTAMNPTPYGEGKTTVSIGLADAMKQLKKNVILTLRQPSLGPVFGLKGGATGGGYSQVVPMTDINLHFTGDFHAITACNNLLCAAIDNHLQQGNELQIDKDQILFHRCLDVNDRSLREVKIGLGKNNGVERLDKFTITAASEIMALFCLATSLEDLKMKLGNIVVARRQDGSFVLAKDLHIEGAMTVLLKDSFQPNLVQTLEYTPTLIHGGPFANIAHGCNSIVATKLALSLADYVITEAGFGADLGAEKFFDITCPIAKFKPNCAVLVATIKSLKYNGGVGKDDINVPNLSALKKGLVNLGQHIENLKKFKVPIVVCLNKHTFDIPEEEQIVKDYCSNYGVQCLTSSAYIDGGKGALSLAKEVISLCEKPSNFAPLYSFDQSIKEKIETICREIYRSEKVIYSKEAEEKIKFIEQNDMSSLPICVAKTQYSFTDDPTKLGAPKDFTVTVKDVSIYNGAGFITVLLKDIMTMPGLPKHANYEQIDLNDNLEIQGIF